MSSNKIANEVNNETLQGFCPQCLGVNIYEVIPLQNEKLFKHAQRIFKGHKYYCFDCKANFDELAPDYIKEVLE